MEATTAGVDVTLDPEKLKTFCAEALETVGVAEQSAAVMAEVLVRTDMRGVRTHGVWLLPAYVRQVREGGADPSAQLETVDQRPGTALLDCHGGLGIPAAHRATELAMEMAAATGVAAVGVQATGHFGAAGHYALMCAEAGFFALITSNANPVMQAAGSSGRVLGNGPTAYGAPRSPGPPFVLDMAMSVVAGQKVARAARRGEAIPEGWIVDPDGRPTTDPNDWFRSGALVPIGGHKGYALALVAEVVAGVLTGSRLTTDVKSLVHAPAESQGVGQMFVVIDVEAFMPRSDFDGRMEFLAKRISASPRAPDVERIYLPGEMEFESEERARERGLAVDAPTWNGLQQLAQDLSIGETLDRARS